MDLFGPRPRCSVIVIFLIFVSISQFGIIAAVDHPILTEAQWMTEFENLRQNYDLSVKGGADGPIPELVECALNGPKKLPKCTGEFREVLLNDALLKKHYKSHDEDCNSHGTKEAEDILLNPPVVQHPDMLNYLSYSQWQEKLINSKLQFCDPLKYLQCSSQNKCVCRLGAWSPRNEVSPEIQDKNTCTYFREGECTHDLSSSRYYPALYFDPFQTSGTSERLEHTVQIKEPRCRGLLDFCNGPFEFLKYQMTCVLESLVFSTLTGLDSKSPSLGLLFNDECNLNHHNRFITYTKEEDEDYLVRIKNIEDLPYGIKLCDLEKFLTCGPSQKCECMLPSTRTDDKCVLPPEFDQCLLNPKMDPILNNKSIIWKTRERLMTGFASIVSKTKCEGKTTCQADVMEVFCTCPPGFTGQECDQPLTKFLDFVRVPSLPTDATDLAEKMKIFGDFNKIALGFEKIFNIEERTTCVWKTQNKAEILVGEIRKLSSSGTNKTKAQYADLGSKIQTFTNDHQSPEICKETLRCRYSTQTCVRLTRQNYLQDLGKELEKTKTLKCKQTGCSKFPKYDDGRFGGGLFKFFGGSHEMEMAYNNLMAEHFELLEAKAQFCAGDGTCSGSMPPDTAICECSGMKVNKKMDGNTTGSLASFRYLPNHVLLMSVVLRCKQLLK